MNAYVALASTYTAVVCMVAVALTHRPAHLPTPETPHALWRPGYTVEGHTSLSLRVDEHHQMDFTDDGVVVTFKDEPRWYPDVAHVPPPVLDFFRRWYRRYQLTQCRGVPDTFYSGKGTGELWLTPWCLRQA